MTWYVPQNAARPPAQRPPGDRARWWLEPLVCTGITVPVLAAGFALGLLSVFATDPCNGEASCPRTFAAIDRTIWLLVAELALVVLQWVPAYWVSRTWRVLLGVLPVVVGLLAIVNAASTPPGQ